MELTNRKKRILRAIVEIYIATAEPVGSKAVAEQAGLDISSATIRNEMADLTEMGYLEQPHTSAGRIPSPLGYRLYVNELMGEHRLTMQETQRINDALNVKIEELDRVIDRAGKVLSQISDYPVFTAAAPKKRVTVKRYDLLMVEENAFIAVVMTDSSVVKNKLIRMPDQVSDPQLQMLSTVLNNAFVGLTQEEMEDTLDKMETRSAPGAFALISLVVQFAMEVLSEQSSQSVHTLGITHLLEHPEYRSLDKAKPLMNYLAEEHESSKLPVTLQEGQNMNILIGPENVNEALKDTSVVMASYDIGDNMRGVIGVVGPTRMDYAKVTARLSYFSPGCSARASFPPATGTAADRTRNRRSKLIYEQERQEAGGDRGAGPDRAPAAGGSSGGGRAPGDPGRPEPGGDPRPPADRAGVPEGPGGPAGGQVSAAGRRV